jgi:hypothetical protein
MIEKNHLHSSALHGLSIIFFTIFANNIQTPVKWQTIYLGCSREGKIIEYRPT